MSTYREIAYICMDRLKLAHDDSFYTIDHILYLASKYRGFLLNKVYKDVKKEIPQSNYQTLCLDLIQVPAISGIPCEGGTFLRTTQKVPSTLNVGVTQVFPVDYYASDITMVSMQRMKYVGENKYLQNIIYCSIGPDDYLYFKSTNPQFLYLEKVRITGIFEDAEKAEEFSCEKDDICDVLDREFPLEEALIPQMVELIINFLATAVYSPEDTENNSKDDLSDLYNAAQLKNLNNDKKKVAKLADE